MAAFIPPLLFLFLFLFSFSAHPASSATTHVVGGHSGWIIPREPSDYSQWASSQTFHVGDVLEFRYDQAEHTVLQVTQSSYRDCNISAPMATFDDGMSRITLSSTGSYYFICGVPGHCDAGQKLELKALQRERQEHSHDALTPSVSPELSIPPSTVTPSPVSGGESTASSSAFVSAPWMVLQGLIFFNLGPCIGGGISR